MELSRAACGLSDRALDCLCRRTSIVLGRQAEGYSPLSRHVAHTCEAPFWSAEHMLPTSQRSRCVTAKARFPRTRETTPRRIGVLLTDICCCKFELASLSMPPARLASATSVLARSGCKLSANAWRLRGGFDLVRLLTGVDRLVL
jgi:hypothetical protein